MVTEKIRGFRGFSMENDGKDDYLIHNYQRAPVKFVRGYGSTLVDSNDKEYLDGLSGIAVCGLGHAHPELAHVLSDQAENLWHTSNLYRVDLQESLASSLSKITNQKRVFFCNSGAEANEAAIKLAKKYGNDKGIKDPVIVTMNGSFHGRTMATLSATGNSKVHSGFSPLLQGFQHIDYDSLEKAAKAIKSRQVVAVLVEPIQGEGGIVVPEKGYLSQLRKLCDQTDTLLMLDEVQTGIGRTGKWFAFQEESIEPDVLTIAKGLGNGIPIGACLAKGVAANVLTPGTHGSTFGGNPLVARVALKVLEIIEREGLLERAKHLGERIRHGFKEKLDSLDGVIDIRGRGLMIGIELEKPCSEIVDLALKERLLVNVASGNVVRLLPPLILKDQEATMLVEKLSVIIKEFLTK